MSAYEMQSPGSAKNKVSHAYDFGPQVTQTGVRVSAMTVSQSHCFADNEQRLFSFSQMFAFALSYMNSWEGISTYVRMQWQNWCRRLTASEISA